MARIRSIKPEFWTDPEIVALPMAARLFFIGTWNHADDYGVLRDDPERLRLQIMPADPIDAVEVVDELVESNLLLRRWSADGTALLVIRTFCLHQKIDKRAVGRWGHPDDFSRFPPDSHQSPPIPADSIPGLEGKGLDRNGTEQSCAAVPLELEVVATDTAPTVPERSYPRLFEEFWQACPKKRAKIDALKAWQAAIKLAPSGRVLDAMKAHAEVWRGWPKSDEQFIPYPASWLRDGEYDCPPPNPRGYTKVDRNREVITADAERMLAGAPSFAERVAAAGDLALGDGR